MLNDMAKNAAILLKTDINGQNLAQKLISVSIRFD
ncbi:hypothetical protein SPSPH_039230 [Sporomusa sphaeroides DSM 2875]